MAKKEEEVADLKQFLEEASVEFLMLGGANYRLEEREARLEEVEADLEAGQSKLGELRRRIGELEGESRVGGEKQVALEELNKELKQLVDKEEKKAAVEEVRQGIFFSHKIYFLGTSKAGRGEDARRPGGEEDFAC